MAKRIAPITVTPSSVDNPFEQVLNRKRQIPAIRRARVVAPVHALVVLGRVRVGRVVLY